MSRAKGSQATHVRARIKPRMNPVKILKYNHFLDTDPAKIDSHLSYNSVIFLLLNINSL